MAIELRQQLKLTQQLIMTPQLQMAIKLLQLSRLELMDKIGQELVEGRIEQPNGDGLPVHGLEEADEVVALHGKQLGEGALPFHRVGISQGCNCQMLRRRHLPQAQTAGEAEKRQETYENDRAR